MAAFSDHWSNLYRLNRHLSILEEECSSQAFDSKKTKKVFETIRQELGNLKSIDAETLQRAQHIFSVYLQKLQPEDKKVSAVVLGILKPTHRQKIEKIQHEIGEAIKQDPFDRQKVIGKQLKKWRNLQGNDLKQAIRSFIMEACRGERSGPPCSIQYLFLNIQKKLSDTDQAIKALLEDPFLFSSYEWKTGVCSEGPPYISDCIANRLKQGKKTMQVSEDAVDTEIKKMENERDFRLRNLKLVYEKISRDPSQGVAGKYYEKTSAWYIGAFIGVNRNNPFENQIQPIGATYGIACITDSHDASLKEHDNLLILDDEKGAPFPQDFVDFSANEIRIPVMNMGRYPEIDEAGTFLKRFFQKKRTDRNSAWKPQQNSEGKAKNPRSTEVRSIGDPLLKDLGKKSVKLALGLGATPIMNLTYNEGGNTLIGVRKDGSKFAIIGLDSYDFSKYLMEKDLSRELSLDEMLMAFAIDYGIKKENAYFVEQPGDFHLDMNLAIVGENTIVVNDAVLAKEMFHNEQQRALKTLKGITSNLEETAEDQRTRRAKGKKIFEDRTADDLEKYKFQVERFPGRLDYQFPGEAAPRPQMNFFNMVTAITPNGAKVVLAMGVTDDKYREKFKEMIQLGGESGQIVHFLDLAESMYCLKQHAGVSCRLKIVLAHEKEEAL